MDDDRVSSKTDVLLDRLGNLVSRVEEIFPPVKDSNEGIDDHSRVFRWTRRGTKGFLKPVDFHARVRLEDLLGVDRQKEALVRNTRQFLRGYEANNALLWGARGTGKSSLIRALVPAFADEGLRLIEVGKGDLRDLPDIVEAIAATSHRFILFCDDLSFGAEEPGFKDLKALLDGALSTVSDRFLIYATSNRRHFMPEEMATTEEGKEIHPEEAVDEKISLSERFGLWLPFYSFAQEMYLEIVAHWLKVFGVTPEDEEAMKQEALRWALARGSRSGRTARQFAKDYAGRWKISVDERRK
ncbi:MAG: ATP-binding protein [Deltaproteobacteria bacterium]|nr:ATP-binding protein [Deltaproteobacteria bacterium]